MGSRGAVALLDALCGGKVGLVALDMAKNGLDHQVGRGLVWSAFMWGHGGLDVLAWRRWENGLDQQMDRGGSWHGGWAAC